MQNIIRKTFWLIVLCLLSVSCVKERGKSEKGGLKKLDWFIGSWTGEIKESIFSETWEKVNDSLFSGQSYFIRGSDTLSRESISLQLQDTSVLYIPLVEGQNDNKPVYFKMVFWDSTNVVFENPGHDFPQKIRYQLTNGDSLIATISGLQEGKLRIISFPMKRATKD
jgi:hypothetical protein